MTRPTESHVTIQKENGGFKTLHLYSYVVLLTEIDGDQVMAVRYDDYERKTDLYHIVKHDYPGWNIKGTWKLYDQDFQA